MDSTCSCAISVVARVICLGALELSRSSQQPAPVVVLPYVVNRVVWVVNKTHPDSMHRVKPQSIAAKPDEWPIRLRGPGQPALHLPGVEPGIPN